MLDDNLDLKKLSAKWVWRLLTILNEVNLVTTLKMSLAFFNQNPSIYNSERNMVSPEHTECETAVVTLGFSEQIGTEEGQSGSARQINY